MAEFYCVCETFYSISLVLITQVVINTTIQSALEPFVLTPEEISDSLRKHVPGTKWNRTPTQRISWSLRLTWVHSPVWVGQSRHRKETRVLMGPKKVAVWTWFAGLSAIIPTVEPHSSVLSSARADYPSTVLMPAELHNLEKGFFFPWATPDFIRSSFLSSCLRSSTCFQLNANRDLLPPFPLSCSVDPYIPTSGCNQQQTSTLWIHQAINVWKSSHLIRPVSACRDQPLSHAHSLSISMKAARTGR